MSFAVYQTCTAIAILVILLIATYFDCKDGTIPILLFPLLPALIVPISVIYGQPEIINSLIGMLIGAATFFILAIWFEGGGGDILMMGVLGWCLGIRGILILILVSSVTYTIFATAVIGVYAMQKRTKEALRNQYPFAPFVLAGFILCLIFNWIL